MPQQFQCLIFDDASLRFRRDVSMDSKMLILCLLYHESSVNHPWIILCMVLLHLHFCALPSVLLLCTFEAHHSNPVSVFKLAGFWCAVSKEASPTLFVCGPMSITSHYRILFPRCNCLSSLILEFFYASTCSFVSKSLRKPLTFFQCPQSVVRLLHPLGVYVRAFRCWTSSDGLSG